MRAALIKAFGKPTDVLELADVPEPSSPAAGEVLVGVEYAPTPRSPERSPGSSAALSSASGSGSPIRWWA
jgi:hypothetical protein